MLFSLLVLVPATATNATSDTEGTTEIDAEEEARTFNATMEQCKGLDPPINNKLYVPKISLEISSKNLTDDYRNVTVSVELRKVLQKNPLLHFYITDEEMYSYQCGNKNSCTYKLCKPQTSQERTLTKQWQGKCPLKPGKYKYEFVFKLRGRILRQKKRTSILAIQAQLHEGYECLACYLIKIKVKRD
ncbi:uncharacterized protein LOC125939890 [Dermacentor silvarum]|uniref:uncharacterized protein LOC125939890 n=1 Tax=Dermacentor silvarum TaxID=543639 RepID=UPI002100CB12|nr:uncharacterized protein LOC125939890 [Dermacentor silvarum]